MPDITQEQYDRFFKKLARCLGKGLVAAATGAAASIGVALCLALILIMVGTLGTSLGVVTGLIKEPVTMSLHGDWETMKAGAIYIGYIAATAAVFAGLYWILRPTK